ncbi:MAG TPA: hypothetical protein VFW94_17215 [Candidatus Acidoferrales bacterium]|nr:hypothetical protein [Candidatus Acidoferrales bacterium]
MHLVEKESELFLHLEEFDIQNDEYLFWDATGQSVCLRTKKRKVVAIENCEGVKPLGEAFQAYCQSLSLTVEFAREPIETWRRIEAAVRLRPKKKSLFRRLFSSHS